MVSGSILGVLLVAVAVGGYASRLAGHDWPRAKLLAEGWDVKAVKTVVQAVAGGVGLASTYAAGDRREWLGPAVAGAVSVVVWELLSQRVDRRMKADDYAAADRIAVYERYALTLTDLLSVLADRVDRKVERLRQHLRGPTPPARSAVRAVQDALQPLPHYRDILYGLATFCRDSLPTGGRRGNVRAGLFVERDGYVEPLPPAIDLNNPSHDPYRSYRDHRDFYRLDDAAERAHIVRCIREKRMLVVADCETDATFHFAHDTQRAYLRSLLCYPVGEVYGPDGMRRAALVVDSDLAGLFNPAERGILETSLREFAVRIRLELLLAALFQSRGPNHDRRAAAEAVGRDAGAPALSTDRAVRSGNSQGPGATGADSGEAGTGRPPAGPVA